MDNSETSSPEIAQTSALDGVKVIDCTHFLAGPFCTMLLGDMGADVIKIEKPNGGDDTRRAGPPFVNGESAAFLGINRNKRSIVLDLKSAAGVEIVRRLVRDADVFVQNLRPGTLERLSLGYEEVHALNPALVYCTVSGYGTTGPYKDRPNFDLIAQGMSGLMSVTGHPGGPPTKIGVPITDLNAGMYAAYGVLSAYVSRLRTGEGQQVDTSLLEAGIAYTFGESAVFFESGRVPGPIGSAHPLAAPYQALATSDGYVNVGAPNQANWERLCEVIGRLDLLEDARFASNAARVENRDALIGAMQPTFAGRTTAEWIKAMEAAGIPCGPIKDMAEVYADAQVIARDMMLEMEHPVAGTVRNIGFPVKLSATPPVVQRPAPTLGQHTEEVLAEHGYSQDEIVAFRDTGIAP